ncbi:hypothetical protein HYV91_02260 [Candidatus Wolfebacteria bacterium]|nr:hypothetical protein [Candidatus Wolfebacteria bacterium]
MLYKAKQISAAVLLLWFFGGLAIISAFQKQGGQTDLATLLWLVGTFIIAGICYAEQKKYYKEKASAVEIKSYENFHKFLKILLIALLPIALISGGYSVLRKDAPLRGILEAVLTAGVILIPLVGVLFISSFLWKKFRGY